MTFINIFDPLYNLIYFIKIYVHFSSSIYTLILLFLIEIRTNIYKTREHPEVSKSHFSIAEQLSSMGEYESALTHLEIVLGKYDKKE
jgi:hypothetical protein